MKAIVLVAFGSTYIEGIKNSIGFLEKDLKNEFEGEYSILTAFTSTRIITLLKERHNYYVPHISETLFNLANDGYEEVYLVPLHIIEGAQYNMLLKIKEEYEYSFKKLAILKYLLAYKVGNDNGVYKIVNALKNDMEEGPILLVGHGILKDTNKIYNKIKEDFKSILGDRFYIATLEGEEKFEKVMEELKLKKINEVTLKTLLIIPGKHYVQDIYKGENSWVKVLEGNNIKVKMSKASLLQYESIRKIYRENIKKEIFSL